MISIPSCISSDRRNCFGKRGNVKEIMDVLIRILGDGFSLYSAVLILSPVVLVRILLTCYGLVSLIDVFQFSSEGRK